MSTWGGAGPQCGLGEGQVLRACLHRPPGSPHLSFQVVTLLSAATCEHRNYSQQQAAKPQLTAVPKPATYTVLMAITLSNLDRFLKLFHC